MLADCLLLRLVRQGGKPAGKQVLSQISFSLSLLTVELNAGQPGEIIYEL